MKNDESLLGNSRSVMDIAHFNLYLHTNVCKYVVMKFFKKHKKKKVRKKMGLEFYICIALGSFLVGLLS